MKDSRIHFATSPLKNGRPSTVCISRMSSVPVVSGASNGLATPVPGQDARALGGVWNAARGPELLARALAWSAAEGDVEVDCFDLERVDTACLQILVALQRRLRSRGYALRLVALRDEIAAMVTMAGLKSELVECQR